MTKIKMVAGDAIHITALGSEPLRLGDEFEVDNEAEAERLVKAGHKRARVVPQAGEPSAPAKRKAR